MEFQVTGIIRTSQRGGYHLVLDVDTRPLLFVVHIEQEPVFSISAPQSFWALCDLHSVEASTVLDLVKKIDAGDLVAFPVSVKTKGRGRSSKEERLWAAKTGAFLSRESLERAASLFARAADTSLLPRPFEYSLIYKCWAELASIATSVNLLEHHIAGHRELVVPKATGGTRVATQLDPLDTILLTACVFELGAVAEQARVPTSENVVHSFRFRPSADTLWSRDYGFHTFQARIAEMLNEPKTGYVLETDISAFYHNVPADVAAHSLERAGANRRILEGVRKVLNSFARVGLPVGPMPSAFFAEAVLNDVDAALLSDRATFVRFNDDYRFFCRSEAEALARQESLAGLLWRSAGLTLQRSKTAIHNVDEYRKRTRAQTDGWLEELKEDIQARDPYADTAPQQLNDELTRKVRSARTLLLEAIKIEHRAWVSLCQRALKALPLNDRLAVIPMLLDQLARLRPIARDISNSLRLCGRQRPNERTELIDLVVSALLDDELAGNRPEYSRVWLARSFAFGEWPHIEKLITISERWPADAITKREIFLSVRNEPALARCLDFDRFDPWLRRAALAATGERFRAPPRATSSVNKWQTTLEGLIAESNLDDGHADATG